MPDEEPRSRQGHAGRGMGDVPTDSRGVFLSFYRKVHLLMNLARETLQTTEARILSGFGWGLTKRIENHGLTRFKANVQRVCRLFWLFSAFVKTLPAVS